MNFSFHCKFPALRWHFEKKKIYSTLYGAMREDGTKAIYSTKSQCPQGPSILTKDAGDSSNALALSVINTK